MKNYLINKDKINELLKEHLYQEAPNPIILKAIKSSFNDGKRLRPIIAYQINKSLNLLNNTNYTVNKIILIPELIHTTSLIIDDLPCMDNDLYRRNNKTIHYEYGERSAQVLSMYLFSKIYDFLEQDFSLLKTKNIDNVVNRQELILENISYNLGFCGAPLGQYLDISIDSLFSKEDYSENIYKLIEKKTATFFELSFVLSYISSGGDLAKIKLLKKAALSFGIAFQISDDFIDADTDAKKKNHPNIVNVLGPNKSYDLLLKELETCKEILNNLHLNNVVFEEIYEVIKDRVKNKK